MDPLDYLRLLRRRWWIPAAVVAVGLLGAYLTLPANRSAGVPAAASYTATHTLLQAPDSSEPVNLQLTSLFATTGEVPRGAAERLGRPADDGPLLAAQVQVVPDTEVAALRITVTDSDGERAAEIANAFAEETKEFLRTSEQRDRDDEAAALQSQIDSLSAQILSFQRRLQGNPLDAPILEAQQSAFTSQYEAAFARLQSLQGQAAASSPLTTLQQAVPVPVTATGSPVPTSPASRLALAGVLGLLLGAALVLLLDRLDTRMREREDVEQASDLPVIAEIPRLERAQRRSQEVVAATRPGSSHAEAYRALRSTLLLVPSRRVQRGGAPEPVDLATWQPPRVVLVTSPGPGDGKTSTVVNLASALAESGRSVLVLDGDFRKPAADRYLGVPRSAGLSELLSGNIRGGLDEVLQTTNVPGVQLVTSGTVTGHPAALLSRLGPIVATAKQRADVVLIDSAPLLVANDATDVLPHVDTVLVVAQAGKTTRPHAERTSEILGRVGVPVLGVVLQACQAAGGVGSYRGSKAHGYGYGDLPAEPKAVEPTAAAAPRDDEPNAGSSPAVVPASPVPVQAEPSSDARPSVQENT